MRTRAVGLLSAAMMLGGLLSVSPAPVGAAPLTSQPFSAYGSGAALALDALRLGNNTVGKVVAASSGGGVNTTGLQAPLVNELGTNIAPAIPDKNAVGRGTGLEAGLLTAEPQQTTVNQVLLEGLAVATAPPPSPLVTEEIPINVDPVVFASLLRGQAQATYDPAFCPIGRPFTFGLGYASNLELLNIGGGTNADTGFQSPVLGTSITAFGTPRGASQSRTVTYLRANGDGTFGVVSETKQTIAPVSILADELTQTALTLEVVGEIGLRATATGKPGGAAVDFLGTPLLRITTAAAGVPVGAPLEISLDDILGPNGLQLNLAPIGVVTVGAPPRAINGAPGSAPVRAENGTVASGALDYVQVTVGTDALPIGVVDLRLGHMEAAATAPAGGVTCDIPVSKVASADPVTAGQDFTYTIRIPSDSALFQALFTCDLINISAVDTVETVSGNPRIQLLGASNGGVISGNRVTWANLGNYTLGQEPITLTIQARIPPNSGAGVLRDTVNVSATLGNCRGGAAGESLVQGGAELNGSAITGSVSLIGPNVTRGTLAATGGNSWPLVAGGGFLLAAFGLLRLRRRTAEVPVKS